jgi:peptidyl-prolyl cis-trans isomerase A (cyclophilin A)
MASKDSMGGGAIKRRIPFRRSLIVAWLVAVQLCGGASGACADEPGTAAPAQPTAPAVVTMAAPAPIPSASWVRVQLHTAQGDIVLALDPVHAPITTANFLHYVDQKRFDGAQFYRAVAIGEDGQYGLLQGGLFGTRQQQFKPIAHEAPSVTGLHHADGAVSMARGEPGTAQSEFFIDIGDMPEYDGNSVDDPGYAVFGHVESGMDLVRNILAMPRSAAGNAAFQGQMLANPVKIISARRIVSAVKP